MSYFLRPSKSRPSDNAVCLLTEFKTLAAVRSLPDGDASQADRELAELRSSSLDAVEGAAQSLMAMVHLTSKHLTFWQAKAKGLPQKKLRTMILERGPWEFFVSMAQILKRALSPNASRMSLVDLASVSIHERVTLLTLLKDHLATALGKIYCRVDTLAMATDRGEQALLDTLAFVHRALQELEGHYDLPKITSADSGSGVAPSSIVLKLKGVPSPKEESNQSVTQKMQIGQALELLADDVYRVNEQVTLLVSHYRRPRKAARLWVQYTAAGVGMAVVSSWLIRHSRLSGSSDLERWVKEGKDAAVTFYQEHALAPLMQIRDDVLQTFRRRPSGSAEADVVHLTAESLRRMLLEFAQQVSSAEVKQPISDKELMEIMMSKYEKEVTHPLQSLVGGELARAMLIQVQKLKLDIETALLELDQILRANEINFAVLAALPALLVTTGLVSLVRQFSLYQQGRGREGRGRAAHLIRRMLMADVERILMESQINKDKVDGLSPQQTGLLLYSIHKLHKSVQRHAQGLGEWSRLQVDLSDLSNPRLDIQYKLAVTARMERIYDSFVPLPTLT